MDSVMGKDLLMAVLNELVLAKRGNIEVHSDILDISLMNLDLEKGRSSAWRIGMISTPSCQVSDQS